MRWLRDFIEWRQAKTVLDMQARLDEKDRLVSVLKAEVDSLAGVIARDRQRIQAETARYARDQAEAEGTTSNDRRRAIQGIE